MNLKKSDVHIGRILLSLENGASLRAACEAAKITPWTFWKWRKDDPTLEDRVKQIELSNISIVEGALFATAIGGAIVGTKKKYRYGKLVEEEEKLAPPNVVAQIFYLTNHAPDRYKNNRDRFLGNGDKDLIESEYEILSDDEEQEAAEMLKEFQK
ncbi:MAG: hypothetical protein PHI19_06165 [Clostridia bacterium]|nr:hypothetical protein [Clostridia bacterium]